LSHDLVLLCHECHDQILSAYNKTKEKMYKYWNIESDNIPYNRETQLASKNARALLRLEFSNDFCEKNKNKNEEEENKKNQIPENRRLELQNFIKEYLNKNNYTKEDLL
jgi:hypothetical protein